MMPLNRNLLFNHPEQIIGVLHYGLPTDDVKLRLVPYHYKGNDSRGFHFPLRIVFPFVFPYAPKIPLI